MEVYVNGHNWLEVQLKKRGIGYQKEDNCILGVEGEGSEDRVVCEQSL